MSDNINPKSSIPKDINNINTTSSGGISDRLNSFMLVRDNPNNNPLVPPYWSKERDKALQRLTLNNDYVAFTLYQTMTKVLGIMPNVIFRDSGNNPTQKEIDSVKLVNLLLRKSWLENIPPFIFDLRSTDNGGHFEIVGLQSGASTSKLEPMEILPGFFVPAIGFRHLMSERVTRTGDEEYPVIYRHTDGKDYKLHTSRVWSLSEMPNGNPLRHGVGFCAVSRALLNITQNQGTEELLIDMGYDGLIGEIIMTYPFSAEQLKQVFEEVQLRGKTHTRKDRHLKNVFMGSTNVPPTFMSIPLRRLPNDYKKSEAVQTLIFILAAAFGVDAREIWPVSVSTRADAETQDKKGKLKFIKWWLENIEYFINTRIIPHTMDANFDYVDSEEQAEVDKARAVFMATMKIELEMGVQTKETIVEESFNRGYISQSQRDKILASLVVSRIVNPPSVDTSENNNLFRIQPREALIEKRFKASQPGEILANSDEITITSGDLDLALEESPDLAKILR